MILEKTNMLPSFDGSGFANIDFGTASKGSFGLNTEINPTTITSSSSITYTGIGKIYLKLLANMKYEFKDLESVNFGYLVKQGTVDIRTIGSNYNQRLGYQDSSYDTEPEYGGIIQTTEDCVLEMHVDTVSGPGGYGGYLPADDGVFSILVSSEDENFYLSNGIQLDDGTFDSITIGPTSTLSTSVGTGIKELLPNVSYLHIGLTVTSTEDTVFLISGTSSDGSINNMYVHAEAGVTKEVILNDNLSSVKFIKNTESSTVSIDFFEINNADFTTLTTLPVAPPTPTPPPVTPPVISMYDPNKPIFLKADYVPVFDTTGFPTIDMGTNNPDNSFLTNTISTPTTVDVSSFITYSGYGFFYLKLLANKKYEFKDIESVNYISVYNYDDKDIHELGNYSDNGGIGYGDFQYSTQSKYGGVIQTKVDCIVRVVVDTLNTDESYYPEANAARDNGNIAIKVSPLDHSLYVDNMSMSWDSDIPIPETGSSSETFNISTAGDTTGITDNSSGYSAMKIVSDTDMFVLIQDINTVGLILYLKADVPSYIVSRDVFSDITYTSNDTSRVVVITTFEITEEEFLTYSKKPINFKFGLDTKKHGDLEKDEYYATRVLHTLDTPPDKKVKKLACSDTMVGRVSKVLYNYRYPTAGLLDQEIYPNPIGYDNPEAFRLLILEALGSVESIGEAIGMVRTITYGYAMNIYPYLNLEELSTMDNESWTGTQDEYLQLMTIHRLFVTLAMSKINYDEALLRAQTDWDDGLLSGDRPTNKYSTKKYNDLKINRIKTIDLTELIIVLRLSENASSAINSALQSEDEIFSPFTRIPNSEEIAWIEEVCPYMKEYVVDGTPVSEVPLLRIFREVGGTPVEPADYAPDNTDLTILDKFYVAADTIVTTKGPYLNGDDNPVPEGHDVYSDANGNYYYTIDNDPVVGYFNYIQDYRRQAVRGANGDITVTESGDTLWADESVLSPKLFEGAQETTPNNNTVYISEYDEAVGPNELLWEDVAGNKYIYLADYDVYAYIDYIAT